MLTIFAVTEKGENDMARYIDAETALKIIDNYAKTVTADGIVIVKAIRDIVEIITPTADVVPKNEVESIITLNSQLEANVFEQRKEIERLTINMNAYGLTVKRLAEERTEIFEKVEKIILDNTYPDFNREHKPVNIWKAKDGYDAFYELKKEYTEGKQ
jgi:hypothetical protein